MHMLIIVANVWCHDVIVVLQCSSTVLFHFLVVLSVYVEV